jgi:hypothetical protein
VYKVALADTVFPDNNNAAVELREVLEILDFSFPL